MGWAPSWLDHGLRAIPGVNTVYDVTNGDWGEAAANLGTGGLYGTANQVVEGATGKGIPAHLGDAWDAYKAPFDEKRQAYDQVSQMAGDIKQQRIARQQDTLKQVLAARDPERKAINALYGDPSTWKL